MLPCSIGRNARLFAIFVAIFIFCFILQKRWNQGQPHGTFHVHPPPPKAPLVPPPVSFPRKLNALMSRVQASNSLGASLWAIGLGQVTSHPTPDHREHIFTPAASADRGAFFIGKGHPTGHSSRYETRLAYSPALRGRRA